MTGGERHPVKDIASALRHNYTMSRSHRSREARRRTALAFLASCVVLVLSNAAWTGATTIATTTGPMAHQPPRPAHYLFPLPAAPVQPEPCPPPPLPPGPPGHPLPPPVIPESAIPIVGVPAPHHVNLAAISGKGIWLTVWPKTPPNAASTVATAHAAGLHQLWIRTGSTHDGYYGGATLKTLIPLAHAAGIAVIAWDFPTMSNPALDAMRAKEVIHAGVDGFGADIESAAEGTYLSSRRVAYYLSLVRAAGNTPVVAIVPPPTTYWLANYPYAAEAPFIDVFSPMVYWSCIEPGTAVLSAMTPLAHMRPLAPIGQDYDMASEGGRHGLPTGREIWRFLDVARRSGAIGASLYDLESGRPVQLATLAAYPW